MTRRTSLSSDRFQARSIAALPLPARAGSVRRHVLPVAGAWALAPLLLLAGCGGGGKGESQPLAASASALSAGKPHDNHLLGEDRSATGGDQTAGGVNAFLWRGAIDTLAFMPFASAEPQGGVIITDWYSPPTTSGERFKITAYILGTQLRSDAIRVSVFRQVQQNGEWVDSPAAPNTAADITSKILARARQLRATNGGPG
ncbi:DUF3576 domain-containing protein [Rhizosaccharibacter radicis]|uniref:DUF3576 domain-containing protein n=1 Tax=Rhizosaccharibacter radicis TaxID=2782605 RepID=A0ABT1VSF2_9PROT|nr:DUF3576 domain-containing protein [Acetobacteraceae bacterium KSS12]